MIDQRFVASSGLSLLLLWASARLVPFVPTIDLQAYKNAIKPLLLVPQFVWTEFIFLTVCWLVFAQLMRVIIGHKWRFLYLPLSIIIIYALEVIIVTNSLTLTDVCAGVAAISIWFALSGFIEDRPWLLAWLLLISYISNAISPFSIRPTSVDFNWIPFYGFLEGSMLINARVLCEKLFVFGGIFWIFGYIHRLQLSRIFLVLAVVLAVEICQIWFTNHTPELTDVLLVVIMAKLFYPSNDSRYGIYSEENNAGKFTALSPRSGASGWLPKLRLVHLAMVGACVCIMLGSYFVMRLPGVPYNIRELFLYGGNGVDLFFFSLSLLGIGWGCAWMGRYVASSNKPVMSAPLTSGVVSIVLYMLFTMSVTHESMMDISGSSVVVHRVGTRGVLGQFGIDFVSWAGEMNLRSVTEIFEPVVRFGALIGPLIMFYGATLAALLWMMGQPYHTKPGRMFAFSIRLFKYLLLLLPWLYFCKVIAFDWSSTDNLNELITRDGPWGFGGGGYLYGLTGLISLCAGFLAWSSLCRMRHIIGAIFLSVVSVPMGWWLLNLGLSSKITKYELQFSGVDFLLGPDRQTLIPTSELFWRWSFVQMAAVGVLALGSALFFRQQGVKRRPIRIKLDKHQNQGSTDENKRERRAHYDQNGS